MTLEEIAAIRLNNQQIVGSEKTSVKELVGWMGAMQAQDYAMVQWAIGCRVPGSTEADVISAINTGDILRTHLLRPTWHIVSADDIYWMLELTAPQIKTSMNSRKKELELTDDFLKSTNAIIENAFSQNDNLTREELKDEFDKAKIAMDNNRASHILMWAELEGLICSGANNGTKQTYALLSQRVPAKKKYNKEEALSKLAEIYFTSHGPATLQDFVWWSGLLISDARKALESIKSNFNSAIVDSQAYFFKDYKGSLQVKDSVFLLPAFDEFIISYKDRSASLELEHQKRSISDNGIFRPVIIINGQVAGIWKRTVKKDKVLVELDLFRELTKSDLQQVEAEAAKFGKFLNKGAVL